MNSRVFCSVLIALGISAASAGAQATARANDLVPPFESLVRAEAKLKPELVGVHPRVFATKAGIAALRERAKTTHREEWQRVLQSLPALQGPPPPPPGPQER